VSGFALVVMASRYSAAGTELLCVLLGQSQQQLGFSEKALSDLFAGLGVAMCFVGLAPLANLCCRTLERLQRPIRLAADLSFPLYILHWPMLVLLSAYGVKAEANPLAFAAILGLVICLSAAFALPAQRKSPALRKYLSDLFAHPRLRAARAG
jgi:peptidoglycan/LPS O-acetylase OafA/YrhL